MQVMAVARGGFARPEEEEEAEDQEKESCLAPVEAVLTPLVILATGMSRPWTGRIQQTRRQNRRDKE